MKFWVPYCDVRYYFCTETMFSSSLPPVCVGELMSYLRYLCLFAQSGDVSDRCAVKFVNVLCKNGTFYSGFIEHKNDWG
jgi:hypothetical protein